MTGLGYLINNIILEVPRGPDQVETALREATPTTTEFMEVWIEANGGLNNLARPTPYPSRSNNNPTMMIVVFFELLVRLDALTAYNC